MRRALAIAFACASVMAAGARAGATIVSAGEPVPTVAVDDDRAGMCDAFEGLGFTFCVALCEARACDTLDAADARCVLLRAAFRRAGGGATPPCEEAGAPLPAL